VRAERQASEVAEQGRTLEAKRGRDAEGRGGARRGGVSVMEEGNLGALAERCQWMGWRRCGVWELVGRYGTGT
jgi:hypothetical protein